MMNVNMNSFVALPTGLIERRDRGVWGLMVEKAKFGRNKENWEKADGQGIAHVNTSMFRMQHSMGTYST